MAKSTEGESTPQYKKIRFINVGAWFTIHVHLIIKEDA